MTTENCRFSCPWAYQCDRPGSEKIPPQRCRHAGELRQFWKTPEAARDAWEKDMNQKYKGEETDEYYTREEGDSAEGCAVWP